MAIGVAMAMLAALSTSPALGAKAGKPGKSGKVLKLGAVVTQTATATATANQQHISATATCPGTMKAVGGGWSTTAGPPGSNAGQNVLVVYQSVMSGGQRSWTNNAYANSSIAGLTLTTYAYCRNLSKNIADVTAIAATLAGSASAATATATCPRKQELLSGGFSSNVGSRPFYFARPFSALKSGAKAWTFQASNFSGPSPFDPAPPSQTLTSHAYCVKGIESPKAVRQTTTANVPAAYSDITAATPRCGRKMPRLSAGGFAHSTSVVKDNFLNGLSWQTTGRRPASSPALSSTFSVTAQGLCLQR